MLFLELGERRLDATLEENGPGAQFQYSRLRLRRGVAASREFAFGLEELARLQQEVAPARGQRRSRPAPPIEELTPEVQLELMDLRADRGLADAEPFGRAA